MSVLLSRPPPMREDDSDLLAETLQDGLNGHHGRHHPLAEDDLEDIITMPVASELHSRRSHSNLQTYLPDSSRNGAAASTSSLDSFYQPPALPPPITTTVKDRQRTPSPTNSRLPVAKAPSALSRTKSLGSGNALEAKRAAEREEEERWETLQVATPPASSVSSPSKKAKVVANGKKSSPSPSARVAAAPPMARAKTVDFPSSSSHYSGTPPRRGSPTNARSSPTPISIPSSSSRKRALTTALSPPSSSSPPSSNSVPRSNSSRQLITAPPPKPRRKSFSTSSSRPSFDEATNDPLPPWAASDVPRLYRSAAGDLERSLGAGGRVDDVVLPAVARRLEAERLRAANGKGEAGLISTWETDGTPRGGEVWRREREVKERTELEKREMEEKRRSAALVDELELALGPGPAERAPRQEPLREEAEEEVAREEKVGGRPPGTIAQKPSPLPPGAGPAEPSRQSEKVVTKEKDDGHGGGCCSGCIVS